MLNYRYINHQKVSVTVVIIIQFINKSTDEIKSSVINDIPWSKEEQRRIEKMKFVTVYLFLHLLIAINEGTTLN